MAEPDWNPDTGGRSLAEILREAGIENASRQSRRRRWDDPEEADLRQRRAEAAAAERAGYGRRKSDLNFDEPPPPLRSPVPLRESAPVRDPAPVRNPDAARNAAPPMVERRQRPRRPPDPSTAAIPGLRPDRKPGVPGSMPSGPLHSGPVPSGPLHSGPVHSGATAYAPPQRAVPPRSASRDEHFSTGPIPIVRPEDVHDDDLDATPRESALAWLRFGGELLIALAAGIAIYFTATLLWDNVPYLAVLLVPVAVTGLVSGVGAWRQRQGREPVSPRLLAVLVIAGTLLTIAPAAGLLAAS